METITTLKPIKTTATQTVFSAVVFCLFLRAVVRMMLKPLVNIIKLDKII